MSSGAGRAGLFSENTLNRNTFYIILLIYIGWVFLLPSFPTQDGGVHLYHANVLSKLLSGAPFFEKFYRIRTLFPPYAAHMYLLILLMKVVSPLLAEKVVTALSIACVGCGLRFLMKSLRAKEPTLAVFGLPLTLSWILFMGFFNYALALGGMLFGLGFWCRGARTRRRTDWIAYVVLAFALSITHPVPLLLLIVASGVELASRIGEFRPVSRLRAFAVDIEVFLAACLSLFYVASFTHSSADLRYVTLMPTIPVHVADLVGLAYVSPLADSSLLNESFRLWFITLAVVCLLAGAIPFARRALAHAWSQSGAIWFCAVALFAAIPLLPFKINGSEYFAQRLIVPALLLLLAATEPLLDFVSKRTWLFTTVGSAVAVILLAVIHANVAPVSRELARIPALTPGHVGVVMTGNCTDTRLNFEPYYWSGSKAFAVSNGVMLNSPWLYLPISSLTPKNEMLLNPKLSLPHWLSLWMGRSTALRGRVLSEADTIVVASHSQEERMQLLRTATASGGWSCMDSSEFSVCTTSGSPQDRNQARATLPNEDGKQTNSKGNEAQ